MAMEERDLVEAAPIARLLDAFEIQELESAMAKIEQFQKLVQRRLRKGRDYDVILKTSTKPSLLKAGAEKICMLMGLRSEFEVMDATRDFENGLFDYQIKCRLFKGDLLITEGLGSCNTKERRYVNQDAFSLDNTILKIAKKRALVDAALLVGGLSDIFTQDIEDGAFADGPSRPRQRSPKEKARERDKPTGGEIRAVYQAGIQAGFSQKELQDILQEELGVDSTGDMDTRDLLAWEEAIRQRAASREAM